MPIFVTTCGMRTDLSIIHEIIIVLIIVAKLVASLIPPIFFKIALNDALALALLLSFKGVVQLFGYTILKKSR
jgi:hypothetical protein